MLDSHKIVVTVVTQRSEALRDEQVVHRNMIIDLKHPSGKSTKAPGNPIKFSRTNEESFSAAPLLAQDTDEILTDVMGKSAEEIAALKEEGVIK